MNIKKAFIFLLKNRQKRVNQYSLDLFQGNNIKSILIYPIGYGIGDATIHTAHLKQLKELFPNAKLGVIVNSKRNKEIFSASGLVDEFVEDDIKGHFRNRKKWDLLLDFEHNYTTRSLFLVEILNPKFIIIFHKDSKKYYNLNTIKTYDFYCPQDLKTPLSHYLNHSNLFIETFGTRLSAPHSQLIASPQPTSLWKKDNLVKIAIFPQGSGREIPPLELAELLNQIDIKFRNKIEIIISYTPQIEDYFNILKKHVSELNINLSPKTNIDEFLFFTKEADLVIAVDGGSLHVACAFDKPVLSFFANNLLNCYRFKPLIAQGIPSCCVISRNPESSTGETCNFELDEASTWLNNQLSKLTADD